MTPKDCLLEKLSDAYGLEQRALRILGVALSKANICPRIRMRLKEHAMETKWQARLLEVCMEQLGVEPRPAHPARKPPSLRRPAAIKALEISTYRALIEAAKTAGETEIAQVGLEILEQETAMSAWLQEHLPSSVRA